MPRNLLFLAGVLACLVTPSFATGDAAFRPPAVPLVTHDPYFSVWSFSDRLYDDWPRHWTGKINAMCGIARVDGVAYRFMGLGECKQTAEQKSLEVTGTQSIYTFACGPVELTVRFTSPLLFDEPDYEHAARPASYVTFSAVAGDGKEHAVAVYMDATAEWAVNTAEQEVEWSRVNVEGLDAMRIGSKAQEVLKKKGDDLRIDWGWFLLAAEKGAGKTAIGDAEAMRRDFAATGALPDKDDAEQPRAANKRWPAMASVFELKANHDAHVILAYDDVYGIEYMKKPLRSWWRFPQGTSQESLLAVAKDDYKYLLPACDKFDKELWQAGIEKGGEAYARLVSLSYRQAIASNKLCTDGNNEPLLFPKECFSNGCISTVDVIYPAAPFFLHYSPDLLTACIKPVLDYAMSDAWKFPFAPHDLGTYPQANGQVYGDGKLEGQMPVEESGNMLILVAAVAAKYDKGELAGKYWDMLTKWAEYLEQNGLDPTNQLCTDDFAGHLARNANLSVKAILGLRSYALLAEYLKKPEIAAKYTAISKEFVAKWLPLAKSGDHTVLAFGKPDTWSQKYNLVWDKLFGFNIFPKELATSELAFYKRTQNKYGLPLDNRKDYTKLDWLVWSATLAESKEDFGALLAPVLTFMNESPSRVPLTDWYDTKTAKMIGFQHRPVIGGVYIRMLNLQE